MLDRSSYFRSNTQCGRLAASCGALLPRLSRAVCAATGATAWNVLQNNGTAAHQAVDHVHFHIIPRVADDGLGFRWNAGSYPEARAAEIQGRIKAELAG